MMRVRCSAFMASILTHRAPTAHSAYRDSGATIKFRSGAGSIGPCAASLAVQPERAGTPTVLTAIVLSCRGAVRQSPCGAEATK